MNNRKMLLFPVLTIGLSLLIASGCNYNNEKNDTLHVAGIEFAPNSFDSNGTMVGIDVDIASQALQAAGIDFTMSMSGSWESAYNATIAGPNKALLTVAYSEERKDLFKWAGPTSKSMYGIFAKAPLPEYPLSLEESKNLDAIAVVRGVIETITLQDFGFDNLVYFDTYAAAVDAFMNNKIPYLSIEFFHLLKKLPPGYYTTNVYVVTRYLTVFNYLAFSNDVDKAVVDKCQAAIDAMVQNLTTALIVQNYFTKTVPTDYIPGTVQIFTESNPPYSYNTGVGLSRKVEGSSVDIVNEIQRRIGYVNKINLSIWTDAYETVKYLPNSAVFTTSRTPAREKLFQWIGPINSFTGSFYTLTSSGVTVTTIDQAKALTAITTPKNWYTHDYLKANNFQNVDTTAITPDDAFQKLVDGKVDALLLVDSGMKWLIENSGKPDSTISKQMTVEELDVSGYIAFSLSTPQSLVRQWQNNLDSMRADGTFKTIWDKWFPGVAMP